MDKANIKHNLEKQANRGPDLALSSKLKTSTVHGILSESIGDSIVSIVTRSNLLDPAMFEAVEGHRINGHAVATSVCYRTF